MLMIRYDTIHSCFGAWYESGLTPPTPASLATSMYYLRNPLLTPEPRDHLLDPDLQPDRCQGTLVSVTVISPGLVVMRLPQLS